MQDNIILFENSSFQTTLPNSSEMLLNPITGKFDNHASYLRSTIYEDLNSLKDPLHVFKAKQIADFITMYLFNEEVPISSINTELAKIREIFMLQEMNLASARHSDEVMSLISELRVLKLDIENIRETLSEKEELFEQLKEKLIDTM
jgi:hypothetical protein